MVLHFDFHTYSRRLLIMDFYGGTGIKYSRLEHYCSVINAERARFDIALG